MEIDTDTETQPTPTLRGQGINVRLDRDTHQKITVIAARLTLHRRQKVQNAQVVREAIDAYLALVEKIGG